MIELVKAGPAYEDAPNDFGRSWERYIERGIRPGSFAQSLLCNDLIGAVRCADKDNIRLIAAHVKWLYIYAPSECWGSEEKFLRWLEKGGLNGKASVTV